MEITDSVSSTGVRNRERYRHIAGWDFISAKEEGYVFIRGKTRDFAKKTVRILWIREKNKNLFFPRDLEMSVKETKGKEVTAYTSFHTKMLRSSGNQRALVNEREVA